MDGVRECSTFMCLCVVARLSQYHSLKRLSFLHCISCLLHRRLVDHRCVCLFLGSPICSIDLYVCFVSIIHHFYHCSFIVLSEVWEDYASRFVLFPQDYLAILGLLCFHVHFRIICYSSVKKCHG